MPIGKLRLQRSQDLLTENRTTFSFLAKRQCCALAVEISMLIAKSVAYRHFEIRAKRDQD